MIYLLRCYAAALPLIGYAVLLTLGITEGAAQVPFLIVEAIAVVITISGLSDRYHHLP